MLKGTLQSRLPAGQRLWDYGVLPRGDEGVRLTIDLMREYSVRDSADPVIVKLASKFTRAGGKSDRAKLESAFNWIWRNVRYTSDGFNEYVRSPRHIVTTDFAGDCDDLSALFASIALAMGYEVWFKVIAWRPENVPENPFTHVYNLVLIPDERVVIPVDCVMEKYGFAREKSPVYRAEIFSVK